MSIKVEFEFATLSDATAFFASVRPLDTEPRPFEHAPLHLETTAVVEPVVAVEPVAAVAAVGPEKPKKAKKVTIKTGKPLEELAEVAEVPTLEAVRAALSRLLASKGVDSCTGILGKYKVTRISELDVGMYVQFIAECGS